MFSISEVSEQTGFSAHTLRYYEKIGLLDRPSRVGGKRLYSAGDIRLLQFLKLLKNTGMSLEDMQEFLVDGCLLESEDSEREKSAKVHKRVQILKRHLETLEKRKNELELVIKLTAEKLAVYEGLGGDERNEG